MKKILLLAALLSAGASASAWAAGQDGPPPQDQGPRGQWGGPRAGGPGRFGFLPKPDQNGVITKEAVLAAVDARFAKVDTNHDGVITPEERKAAIDAARARRRAEAERPVTLAEQRERAVKMFDRIDTNHDGKIDQAELAAFRAKFRGAHGGFGGRRGGPGGPGGGAGGPPPAPDGN